MNFNDYCAVDFSPDRGAKKSRSGPTSMMSNEEPEKKTKQESLKFIAQRH